MSQQFQTKHDPPPASPRTVNRSNDSAPLKDLTLQETLRVMDVAREMRDSRRSAEEMFHRDDLRSSLREKLIRTAQMSGEEVTQAEIDAAISQYLDRLHTFEDVEPGINRLIAHAWIWRLRIAGAAAAATALAGSFWYLFN